MIIDNELIKLASTACIEAYQNNIDLGTTEFALTMREYHNKPLQMLALPGTNEMADWLWNLYIRSTEGVKRGTYLAAEEIHEAVYKLIDPDIPFALTAHSKAGATVLQLMAKYGADACVAFCPAPAFRRSRLPILTDTVIVIDPDDFVPIAGIINFGQPIVERTIKLPKDKKWYNVEGRVDDHDMVHIDNYVRGL